MRDTFESQPGMGQPIGQHALRPGIARYIGGRRGFIDGALPPMGFVAVNAVAGAVLARPDALRAALATAVGTGLALVTLRIARREPLQQAFRGLVGLAVAAVFAARTGEARDFFLPASMSTLPGRPSSPHPSWRADPSSGSCTPRCSGADQAGEATPDCAGRSPS